MATNPQYTREVGRKFHADGTPRRFPGNTIICFVDEGSPIGLAASAFQDELRRQAFGAKFTLLPPASFHMTVMELLCDQVRVLERWSNRLPLDAALITTDAFFLERVPAIPAPSRISMRVSGLFHRDNLMVMLEPADATTAAALRDYRAAVVEATGVRFPDHDSYGFHISLAYRLLELESEEEAALVALGQVWEARMREAGAAIALGAPALTFFDDMFRFVPADERPALRGRREE